MVGIKSWGLGNVNNFFTFTPRSTLTRVVVPARVRSMGKIEPFNHLLRIISNFKPYVFVQIVCIR